MVKQQLTDSQVISTLGGTVATARLFGIAPNTVSNWRRRGIPGRYQYSVAEVCRSRGIEWTPRAPQTATP